MFKLKRVVLLSMAASLALLLLPLSEATSPTQSAPSQDLADGLRRAFSQEDGNAREDAIREVLAEHLLSNDPNVAKEVWQYLFENERWIDVSGA